MGFDWGSLSPGQYFSGKLKGCKNDIRDYISRDGRAIIISLLLGIGFWNCDEKCYGFSAVTMIIYIWILPMTFLSVLIYSFKWNSYFEKVPWERIEFWHAII